jgi:hypothetical protein
MGNILPTFYTGCNFSGIESILASGKYNLNQMGLPNNTIQSVIVPKGFKVTLYEETDFQGGNIILDASKDKLESNFCDLNANNKFNTGGSVNKNTSSIKVEQISGFVNTEELIKNGHTYWICILILVLIIVLISKKINK